MADGFSFSDEYILVGKVAKPHGLRGEFKVQTYSGDAETILQYSRFFLVDTQGYLTPSLPIQRSRIQGRTVIIKLEGVDDRSAAESIQGKGVLVSKNDLPVLAEDEFYWYQMIDLPVFTADDQCVGTISSIFSNGAQDIMVIKSEHRELLVPIIDSIIKEHTEKGVVITPPPGLLEIQKGADE